MNSIVIALKQNQDEAGKSGQWKMEELCKMAALEIETKAARIAELTAARAMQGEELVTLPRHMVYSMEDKLKEQAAYIEWANAKIKELEAK